MQLRTLQILCACLLVFIHAQLIFAQTTTFTYQGKLTDNGNPANSNYDLQFTLWDALSGGTQQPQPGPITVTRNNVTVSGGIFTVQLDFTVNAFPGADRFLEISVRPAGVGSFTTLSPRQQLNPSPYAIRTLSAASADNANQLGGVAASQYVQTNDARLSDDRPPTAGSSNYIQANPASTQTGANFNISGNGTAGGTISGNTVNSTTQYNLGGNRILAAPGTNNLFAGFNAGLSNSSGSGNSFVGQGAGQANNTSSFNSYFGFLAGQNVTTTANAHSNNSFFGASAGRLMQGSGNSIFGSSAGGNSTQGEQNSFFGFFAGFNNTASGNSFFGASAGQANTNGDSNSFFGAGAGAVNRTGRNNAFFGIGAGQSNDNASNNSFFGAQAGAVNIANANSFFGYEAGFSNDLGSANAFFGDTSGQSNTSGSLNSFFGYRAGSSNTASCCNSFFGHEAGTANTGDHNSFFGSLAGANNTTGSNNTLIGSGADVTSGTISKSTAIGYNAKVGCFSCVVLGDASDSNLAVGIGTTTPSSRLHVVAGSGIPGIFAFSSNKEGVNGTSGQNFGVVGNGYFGVIGFGNNVPNNTGYPFSFAGVVGQSNAGIGVIAVTNTGYLMAGVQGSAPNNYVEKFHILNDGTYVAGGDFAEALPVVDSKTSYEPGDVLVISEKATGRLAKSNHPHDVHVAGVYSTRPGVMGADKNGETRVDADDVPVAIVGIVPTKVSVENGPIRAGDLLTTSRTPGYAMKASPVWIHGVRIYRTGTILGKALESLDHGKGLIKVLITLR